MDPTRDSIVTGEAVELDLRVARVPSRMIAATLDIVVQVVLLVLGIYLVSELLANSNEAATAASTLVLVVGVLVGYPVLLETLWRGRTLGKAALGLRVVRDDGGPIRFRQAFVRGLVGAFEKYLFFGVPVIPIITSLVSKRAKRVGDILAGTVVISERGAKHVEQVAWMPLPLADWAASLDLSRLPNDLALSARQFVSRADELHPAAREELGGRLVAAIGAVVSPPPPPGTPGWAYLSAVLAERRRREEQRLQPAPMYPPWEPDPGVGFSPRPGAPPPPPPPEVPSDTPPPPGPGGFVLPG